MAKSWRGWAGSAIVVAVVGAAAACSSSSAPVAQTSAPVPAPVQQEVGATGGSVTNTEGTGVDIPPGAVPSNVTVSVTPAPQQAPPPAAKPVGTPYVFGPSGLQFAKPVTVTLAFDPTKLPRGATAADIVVLTAPDGTTNYERLKTTLKDATHVAADTTHFSVYLPAVQTAGSCTPIACQPNVCGVQDNGCGGTLNCGACSSLDAGCTPVLCGAYGPSTCGTQSNGCGGTLDCGICPVDAGPDSGVKQDGGSGGGASDAGGSDGGTCVPSLCSTYPSLPTVGGACVSCGYVNVSCADASPTYCNEYWCDVDNTWHVAACGTRDGGAPDGGASDGGTGGGIDSGL